MMYTMLTLLLLGSLLLGLILLATGLTLLLAARNKIVGILVGAFGLALTFFPIGIYLFLITVRIPG